MGGRRAAGRLHLADIVNLDVLLPIVIVPALILFAVLVLPYLFRGRP